MRKVLLDTSALIAMSVSSERLHDLALARITKLRAERARLVLHRGIEIELLDTLAQASSRETALTILDGLDASRRRNEVEYYELNTPLVEAALNLYRNRMDKEWGLTDCISFVLMEALGIYEAFTLDHHFVQAGFHRSIPVD